MTDPVSDFVHVFEPASDRGAPVLLLLHGTGGNERDLLPLGHALWPGAAVLSPRGKVLEHGKPRFFRRLAEGVFDLEDLRLRTTELAAFLRAAAGRYGFTAKDLIAAGFSNGANMAGSLLLLEPGSLGGAVLFRAMVPIVPDPLPALASVPVLVSNGRRDPLVASDETERLAALLRRCGADVTLAWQNAGHELTPTDVDAARDWIRRVARRGDGDDPPL
jgi:predicted esterase